MWGDAAWTKRQEEMEAHRQKIDQEQWDRGTVLEKLLKKAETDRDAFQVIELARLLDSSCFKMREEGLENAQRMRSSAKGNDPSYQDAIRVHERVARLSIEYAIRKAEAVLWLVRSWEEHP
ncbi:hypothetical protein [Rhizobium sp. RCAM05973]|uniref:hypothetical protein n=1 Tax=Rhizobium sp. RCAM05973 TaxID=2994066 RepID=UPI0022EBA497|nr:hypothetical protein [Rhizobium sp. RCAM05973]